MAGVSEDAAATRWYPSYDQVIKTQLSRNDLVQLINDPALAENIIGGFFIRVLIELSSGAEDYRAYTIRRLVRGRSYAGFSTDRNTQTTFYLELNTPAMLEQVANGTAPPVDSALSSTQNGNANSSTSFQLNCISNSPISKTEYDVWCGEIDSDPILSTGDEGITERKDRQVSRAPSLTGPNVRRNNRGNNNNNQNSNAASPVSSNPSGAGNNNSALPVAAAGGGGGLGRTVREAAKDNGVTLNAGGNIVTGAANNAANQGGSRGGASNSTSNQEAIQDQLLASFKRNNLEELREQFQVFIDPRLYSQTKLAVLRTMENDLGDYIEKLREVVQAKKPTCVVCYSKIPSVVFLPCRHMALCRSCAVDLVSAKCPLCRETIVDLWEPEEEM